MILINTDRFSYSILTPLGFVFPSLGIFNGKISYESGDGV